MKFKISNYNLFLFAVLFLAFSCASKKYVDVKSPCASSFGGPCGERKPVNDWWIKDKFNNNNLT